MLARETRARSTDGRRGSRGSKRSVLLALLLGLATIAAGCGDSADDGGNGSAASGGEPEKLKVAIAAIHPSAGAAVFAAQGEGYFEREGLEVEIQDAAANTPTAVVSGQVDIGVSSPVGALSVVNEGQDAAIIGKILGNGFAAYGVGVPSVKSFKDCKKVVTNALGTTAFAWTGASKEIFGADYEVLPGGNTPDQVQALITSGRADCGMGNYSYFAPLVDEGKLKVLVDPTKPETLPPDFPQGVIEGSVWGLKSHLEDRRPAIEKFMRAITLAYQEKLKPSSISDAEIADMYAGYDEFKALAPTMETIVTVMRPFISPDDGYISEESWPVTVDLIKNGGLDFLSTSDPKWSYESRVDMSYYDEGVG